MYRFLLIDNPQAHKTTFFVLYAMIGPMKSAECYSEIQSKQ